MRLIHTTYQRCGHVLTDRWTWDRSDVVEHHTSESYCRSCRDALAAVDPEAMWVRAGYNSPEAYEAAVEHGHAVRRVEEAREARLAALDATPASERPFVSELPISRGGPTLDELAADAGEPVEG